MNAILLTWKMKKIKKRSIKNWVIQLWKVQRIKLQATLKKLLEILSLLKNLIKWVKVLTTYQKWCSATIQFPIGKRKSLFMIIIKFSLLRNNHNSSDRDIICLEALHQVTKRIWSLTCTWTQLSREHLLNLHKRSTILGVPRYRWILIITYLNTCQGRKRILAWQFCKTSKKSTVLWRATFWKTNSLSRSTKAESLMKYFRRKRLKIRLPLKWPMSWRKCTRHGTLSARFEKLVQFKHTKT